METNVRSQIKTKRPRPWKGIGLFVLGALCTVGLITVASSASRLIPHTASAKPATQASNTTGTSGGTSIASLSGATFSYLVPAKSEDWSIVDGSEAFDKTKGVAKYSVLLIHNQVHLTLSQQAMPVALMPRGSTAFSSFITSSKVSRSQDVGAGTLYFLPALQNGSIANGADTVIYATDGILLFGRAESVVGYDAWVKLIGSLSPHN